MGGRHESPRMRKVLLITVAVAAVALLVAGALAIHRILEKGRALTTITRVATIAQVCELTKPRETGPDALVAAARAAGATLPSIYLKDGWDHPIFVVPNSGPKGPRSYDVFACGQRWPCSRANADFYVSSGKWVRHRYHLPW